MDEQTQAIVAGLVRHAIGALGAALVSDGIALTGGQLDTITGAVMVLVAVSWSAWHKTTVEKKP